MTKAASLPIPVNEPSLGAREKELLNQCIETGWISSDGPFVAEFEQKFAECVGRKYGIAVVNGSAALDAAVAALRLGPGDEVILPSFTIISCAAAIARAGAMPVTVDCDPLTWNMTAEAVAECITPRTRAIMVVHIYGLPVDMDPILALADKHRLRIIEDAAEMHGQTYKSRPCGSFGDLSTFSFYPNKLITTGEGGMIVTDDPLLADRCRSLRNLCFQPQRRFVHEEIGWNLRMSNIQAALGLAQLERIDEFLRRKRAIGRMYTAQLKQTPGLQLPLSSTTYADNVYWVYGVVLDDDLPFDAEHLMTRLAAEKIGTRPFFWPMHEQPVFRKRGWFENVSHPVSERISRRGFYIPSGLAITDEQVKRVSQTLREFLT
jgi:perosamine synthetase